MQHTTGDEPRQTLFTHIGDALYTLAEGFRLGRVCKGLDMTQSLHQGAGSVNSRVADSDICVHTYTAPLGIIRRMSDIRCMCERPTGQPQLCSLVFANPFLCRTASIRSHNVHTILLTLTLTVAHSHIIYI